MEYLKWIPVLLSLFLAGFNAAIFIIVKFNDLKHLGDDIKEIKDSINGIDKKLYTNAEKIAKIEGKCLANHG